MKIITRAQWGARPPKGPLQHTAINSRTATCIHYDGGAEIHVSTFEQACALIRKDQTFHMDTRGWWDIGYNYLITSAPGTPVDGLVFEARGRDAIGAHCLNWNTPWIGIQVAIGGAQKPSPAALASARALHDNLQAAAGHSLAMKGHKDGFNTACPGAALYAWVKSGMPAGSSPASALPTALTTQTHALLTVDGLMGPSTLARLGVVLAHPADPIRAMQRYLHVTADGNWGPATTRALQGHYGTPQDGVISKPSAVIKAMQARLNTNHF